MGGGGGAHGGRTLGKGGNGGPVPAPGAHRSAQHTKTRANQSAAEKGETPGHALYGHMPKGHFRCTTFGFQTPPPQPLLSSTTPFACARRRPSPCVLRVPCASPCPFASLARALQRLVTHDQEKLALEALWQEKLRVAEEEVLGAETEKEQAQAQRQQMADAKDAVEAEKAKIEVCPREAASDSAGEEGGV